ncbi:MAG TPA: amino acid adenylation domain-containing protein, partial [Thermoanaerobaculia bacterium]|nr:amino acid adenylation domain-containing protein [Thermoanaerobaculia bacterium]
MIDPMELDLPAAEPEAERRELLELLLQEQEEQPESFPVSFAQQRLWFLDQLDPGSAAYNLPVSLRLAGSLQPAVLHACLQEVVQRHEALRTVFAVEDGEPVQRVTGWDGPELPLVDLAGLPAALREPELRRVVPLVERQPFDLAAGPLLRAVLIFAGVPGQASGQASEPALPEHILVVSMHHIVSDGWSLGVFVREVVALYSAFASGQPSPLPELPIQYVDYAAWQRDHLTGAVLAAQLDYWRRQLAGAPPGLDLPADRPRPPQPTGRGGSQRRLLPPAVAAAVRSTVRREGVTLFMLTLAAFDLLLGRVSGQEDLSVGTPIAGRGRGELEGLIGFFINTLVLRTDLGGDPTFGELLARVRQTSVHAYDHQDLPFERLVEELAPERDLGRSPLFQVLFAVQNAPPGGARLPGLAVTRVPTIGETAKFDLSVSVTEPGGGGLRVGFEFSRDLFDDTTVLRLLGHFSSLLAAVSSPAGLGLRLSEVPLLSAGERQQLLREWNPVPPAAAPIPPTPPTPPTILAHRRIAEQARWRPEHPAAEIDGRTLTYGELDRRSAALALHLRALGVGPEVPVGICCPRSIELVVGFVATLRAGGAYLPLDPSYPRERLELLLADSGASVVVCPADRPEGLPEEGVRIVRLAPGGEILDRTTLDPPTVSAGAADWGPAAPENLAYVIYTSGSTGRPKGVGVSHGEMAAHLATVERLFGLVPEDRVLQFAAPGFDLALEELVTALGTGATLVLRGEELWAPGDLLERFAALRLTYVGLPTAYWHTWVQAAAGAALPPGFAVRIVFVGGEAMSPEAARLWGRTPLAAIPLLNGYGPTEAVVITSLQKVTAELVADWPGAAVPIGPPIEERAVYVLGRRGSLQPAGVPGELCVGGRLARGYLGRPALTTEKFVPDPWSGVPGARLYRSGDLVRWLPGGSLEFLGRIDFQVKVRGYRIELGEVEHALAQLPGVAGAVAIARGDRLLAYVVPAAGALPQPAELRAALRGRLPEYMVPSVVVSLPARPLTPNGKVDRRALPEPVGAPRDGAADGAARTPLQEVLAGIWAAVLDREQVGLDDSFFDLGGHSLKATQLLSKVREVLRVEVPLRAIFEAPSVAAFASQVESALRGGTPPPPPLAPVPRAAGELLPLSFAQERLWFLAQLEPDSAAYLIPAQLRLAGELDAALLGCCLGELVRRHEALRTTFRSVGGHPFQVVAAPVEARDFALPVVDLSGLPEPALTRTAERLARLEAGRPCDLATGPLLRATLLRRGAGEHTLLLTQHHIVSDGWSMGVLIREMRALYQAWSEGRTAALPPLPIQYPDYAAWQRVWLSDQVLDEHLVYWRERLAGAPALLELPADRPRPPVRSGHGARRPGRLGSGLAAAVRALGRGSAGAGTTPFMVLLAAFQALLGRYTGQSDLVVGIP